MNRHTEKAWLDEFQEFTRGDTVTVPKEAEHAIFARVRRDLNPSARKVFGKLFGLHAVVGTFSLAICNQFGLNPFHTNFTLSDYFMTFGHSACMFLCGLLFLSGSVLLACFVLGREEARVFRRSAGLQVFGLSMLSLGVFMAAGAQLALSIALLWLLGAMIGGTSVAFAVPKGRLSFSNS